MILKKQNPYQNSIVKGNIHNLVNSRRKLTIYLRVKYENGKRQECLTSPFLFSISLDVLSHYNGSRKRNRSYTDWKGREKTVICRRSFIHIENPKDSAAKLSE